MKSSNNTPARRSGQISDVLMAGIIRQTVIDALPKAWRTLPSGRYAADVIATASMLRISQARQAASAGDLMDAT